MSKNGLITGLQAMSTTSSLLFNRNVVRKRDVNIFLLGHKRLIAISLRPLS